MVFNGIYEEEGNPYKGFKLNKLKDFLLECGLKYDESIEHTVIYTDDNGEIKATGSLSGNVLKCIAVSETMQGEGLSAAVLSHLTKYAIGKGISHLFLFTKPKNLRMFEDMGFYKIIETGDILFMENKRNGIDDYARSLMEETQKAIAENGERNSEAVRARDQAKAKDTATDTVTDIVADTATDTVIGAIVANCNPFTYGHRYLIEEALKGCDLLHLFILSEDRSYFSAAERYEMVKAGVGDLLKEGRLILHKTSDYLISSATFPTYFIKDTAKAAAANCELDVRIFAERIARPLNITRRFAGTEPTDVVTNEYNETMKRVLPEYGIEFVEIERMISGLEGPCAGEAISAKRVRKALSEGDFSEIERLVPPSTLSALKNRTK
ncbi:MAG: adenylyltransferase/cytidyltransferase family protein [Eubacteriales bacterium]|nr:adenylyltransferase/cytidyltransferase family protein [Eubacteriales bacterium]